MVKLKEHIISNTSQGNPVALLFSFNVGSLPALLLYSSGGSCLSVRTAAGIVLLTLLMTSAYSTSLSAAAVVPALTALCGFASAPLTVLIVEGSRLCERLCAVAFLLVAVPYQFVVGAAGISCAELLKDALSAAGKRELYSPHLCSAFIFLAISLVIAAAVTRGIW